LTFWEDLVDTLKLKRPLVVFDLETTGADPEVDRIVEFCAVRYLPGDDPEEVLSLVLDPGVPIPESAAAVHGFTDEAVRGCPRFGDVLDQVEAMFANADVAGYNVKGFDLPLLVREFRRAGLTWEPDGQVVDVLEIFRSRERHDLASACRRYLGQQMEGAHRAQADVLATVMVLQAQLEEYEDLPREPGKLARFKLDPDAVDGQGKLRWQAGEAVFTFGKLAGMSLAKAVQVDPGYLQWMLGKDFSDELKDILRAALAGRLPVRNA